MSIINKEYGVKMSLPADDTMRAAHLLGDNFSHIRWFKSIEGRDHFLQEYQAQHQYYRKGDLTRFQYECVER